MIVVRDRFGLEPVYLAEAGDRLVVGPRPAAVAQAAGRSRSPDPLAVLAHLHGHSPLRNGSFLVGVESVPPGSAVVFTPTRRRVNRYWSPRPQPVLRLSGDDEYAAAFAELLGEVLRGQATPRRAGVAMSGGLDSTAVAALLAGLEGRGSLGVLHREAPEVPEADESAAARAVADHLGLPLLTVRGDVHHPVSQPQGLHTVPDTPLLPPFHDPWEATFVQARDHGLEVVYTGAGGDHLVGGSAIFPYADLLLRFRWNFMVSQLRRHGAAGGSWLRLLDRAVARPLARWWVPCWRPAWRVTVPWLGAPWLRTWRRLQAETRCRVPAPRWLLPSRRDRLRFLTEGASVELAHELAHQAGRHGLSLRHPLLDTRLMDFVLALPAEQFFRDGRSKWILRRVVEGLLPAAVLDRPKVYPFALYHRGLRERGRAHVERLTRDMRAAEAGFVDEERLRAAYRRYRSGSGGGGLLWNALTLEDWLRRYF